MSAKRRMTLLLAAALSLAASPAGARACGRWIVTMASESGSDATLRLTVRECGLTEAPSHLPPACKGHYRCHGRACPSRRGRFLAFGRATSDRSWAMGNTELRPRRPGGHRRTCFTLAPFGPDEPSRYTCYSSDDEVADRGTLSCVTERACGDFVC
jgi:hypothetical protein